VESFALYAFGKPTPKTFFPNYLSAVIERLWRTLMIHPEFQDMPSNTKFQVLYFHTFLVLIYVESGDFERKSDERQKISFK